MMWCSTMGVSRSMLFFVNLILACLFMMICLPLAGQGAVVNGPVRVAKITYTPTLIATGLPDSWVIIQGGLNKKQTVMQSKAPQQMTLAINALLQGNQVIHAIAITPDNKGWVVVTNKTVATFQIPRGIEAGIRSLHKDKVRITGIAFNPYRWNSNPSYVILAGAKSIYSGVAKEMTGLFKAPNTPISVAFTETGGWAMIYNNGIRNRFTPNGNILMKSSNLPKLAQGTSFDERFKALAAKKQYPQAIAFPKAKIKQQPPWLMVGEKFYEAALVPGSMRLALQRNQTLKGDIYYSRLVNLNKHIPLSPIIQLRLTDIYLGKNHLTEKYFDKDPIDHQNSEPMIMLYQFGGRIDGQGRILIYDNNADPIVIGLKSGQQVSGTSIHTNWASPKRTQAKLPNDPGTKAIKLQPYHYTGIIAVVIEPGTVFSLTDYKTMMSNSLKSVLFGYNKEFPVDRTNYNFTSYTPENAKKIGTATIDKLEAFRKYTEHQTRYTINYMIQQRYKALGYPKASLLLKAPNLDGASADTSSSFVRDIRMIYTMNLPNASPQLLRQFASNQAFVPIGATVITKQRPVSKDPENWSPVYPEEVYTASPRDISSWKGYFDYIYGTDVRLRAQVTIQE